MSVTAMAIVWGSDLPRPEKLVLLAYADIGDDDGGNLFPSYARIAWKTGYDKKQVQRIVKGLVNKGYMNNLGKSHLKTISYKIRLDLLPKLAEFDIGNKMSPIKDIEDISGNIEDISGNIEDISGNIEDISGNIEDIAMSPDPLLDPLRETVEETSLLQEKRKALNKDQLREFSAALKGSMTSGSYENLFPEANVWIEDRTAVVETQNQHQADRITHFLKPQIFLALETAGIEGVDKIWATAGNGT